MRKVIDAIVDDGSWLEIKKLFAKELLTGFARLDGHAVGIVANQPMQKGGVLFSRLSGQGGAIHLALRRVRDSACCSWPTCPAS
jgi:acetyl-CoA carboxylase carboxyltransferase component